MREGFRPSERAAIAEAMAVKLQGRVGNPSLKSNSGNISLIDKCDTRDITAAVGLCSGKTLEAH